MDAVFAAPIASDAIVGCKVTKVEIYPEFKTLRVEYDNVLQSGARVKAQVVAIASEPDRYDAIIKTLAPAGLAPLLQELAAQGEIPAIVDSTPSAIG